MNNRYIKKFYGIVAYVEAPLIIICASQFLYIIADFSNKALSSYRDVDYSVINSWICLVTVCLISHSILHVITKHNNDLREKYRSCGSKLDLKERLTFAFRESGMILKSLIASLIYIIMPIRWTNPALAVIFNTDVFSVNKFIALSVFLPILFIIALLSHLSAYGYWWRCSNQMFYGKKVIIKNALTIALTYTIGEFFIINALAFFDSNKHIIKQLLTYKTLIALLIPIILITAYIYLRALFKRNKCIKQLIKICCEKGYALTGIQYPYRSVFKVCEGESFKVGIGNKTYSCKFIGTLDSLTPLALYPNGTMVFLDKNPFKVTTIYKFAYKSDCPQILVLNPTPRHVYAHQEGNRLAKVDNGDRVGNYKLYTATAFLRALELDVLDRNINSSHR